MLPLHYSENREVDVPRVLHLDDHPNVVHVFPEPPDRIELSAVVYKTTALPLSDGGRTSTEGYPGVEPG